MELSDYRYTFIVDTDKMSQVKRLSQDFNNDWAR